VNRKADKNITTMLLIIIFKQEIKGTLIKFNKTTQQMTINKRCFDIHHHWCLKHLIFFVFAQLRTMVSLNRKQSSEITQE